MSTRGITQCERTYRCKFTYRVTACFCAMLSLRYHLRHSIPLALALFYLQNEKIDRFLFRFRCPICLPPDWESEIRGKTFWCPWKTCGRAGATSGLAFDCPLKGRFTYILRFASVVYIIHRFHCMKCLYRAFTMHF